MYNRQMGKWVHRLSFIDDKLRTGVCSMCGPVKLKKKGNGKWRCYLAFIENHRKTRRNRYDTGVTPDDIKRKLAEIGNKCEICLELLGNRFDFDHDHLTGKARGILCRACNLALGKFKDNPDILLRAIEYIQREKSGF